MASTVELLCQQTTLFIALVPVYVVNSTTCKGQAKPKTFVNLIVLCSELSIIIKKTSVSYK